MAVAERRTQMPEVEIDRVCETIVAWHRYAPEVKAELFSTAVIATVGAYLVGPIQIDPAWLQTALAPAPIAGVIITNENHARAAAETAADFGVTLMRMPRHAMPSVCRPQLNLRTANDSRPA